MLGDVIRLSGGEQIPSDALVLEGFAEVNEAMLTGESDLVQKEVDGLLLSGSFLASGSVYLKFTMSVQTAMLPNSCLRLRPLIQSTPVS